SGVSAWGGLSHGSKRQFFGMEDGPPGCIEEAVPTGVAAERRVANKLQDRLPAVADANTRRVDSVGGGFAGTREASMKADGRYRQFFVGLAIALFMLAVPPGAGAATRPSGATDAHVYLLRGLLNVFSLGLDEIAAKLQQQGIPVTIANYVSWQSIADQAAADYKSGRVKTIILVGHSSGATVLPDVVARLDQLGAPAKLVIGLDSIYRT